MGFVIYPKRRERKGILVDPKRGKRKGSVKKPDQNDIWTGYDILESGTMIPRIMNEKDALEWSKKTGKNIWKKMTVGDLREL